MRAFPLQQLAVCFFTLALGLCRFLYGASPPIHYLIDLRDPGTHLVQVTMTIPEASPETEVQIPTWNNLYQIRDFVQDVRRVQGTCDGESTELVRVDLNTWRGPNRPCSPLELQYKVYANHETPFSSVLNPDHAFLNFALLLFYMPQERARSAQVKFLLPRGWKLATLLEGKGDDFHAPNYDALVDSPAEAGHFQEFNYSQKVGIPRRSRGTGARSHTVTLNCRVIVDADPHDYSAHRLLNSLKKITAAETALMEDVPFTGYTFIFHFLRRSGSGGGMEHRDGTAITLPVARLQRNWGSLESMAAHEFFHAWNVKRIRPQSLEPIDYIHGNDTRDLWFCEGVTSTYAEYCLLRAGLTDRQAFYGHIAGAIHTLESRPARHFQSVEMSGREAWLEKYADYLRPERSVSYYNKGELLGFLLDLGIRHATHNQASLDDLMRCLNQQFAQQDRFFTESALLNIITNLAPSYVELEAFFRDYVHGTRDLDYDRYLGYAGLRLVRLTRELVKPGFNATRNRQGLPEVESVDPGSPAQAAGLAVGDVLLEANGHAVADLPEARLPRWKPGEVIEFTILRGGETHKVKLPMEGKQEDTFRMEEDPSATADQLEVREGWLKGKTSPPAGMQSACSARCLSH